ncbi:hypothetical protein HDU90_006644 [Geranomyces variabilis]|nr:hypothetical protein HDU90_006644 [Geranomyces variabilis]
MSSLTSSRHGHQDVKLHRDPHGRRPPSIETNSAAISSAAEYETRVRALAQRIHDAAGTEHRPEHFLRRSGQSDVQGPAVAVMQLLERYDARSRRNIDLLRKHQVELDRAHADEITALRAKLATYQKRTDGNARNELSKTVTNLVRTSERERDNAHDALRKLARNNAALQDLVAEYEMELDVSQQEHGTKDKNYFRASRIVFFESRNF